MSDLISRQAALEKVRAMQTYKLFVGDDMKAEVQTELMMLPSAQTEQRWIPCSERLPEEMGTYMTTIDYGEHGLVTGQRYYYGRGLKWNDECVIAWMPLPEPYKAESGG